MGGDPASVEIAGLGLDGLAVYRAAVDAGCVEGEVVAEGGVGCGGGGVAPGGVGRERGGDGDGPVGGGAFELAEAGAAVGGNEILHGDVGLGNVEDGWVAGFEDADGVGGVGKQDAVVLDAEMAGGGLEARGAGIVPYGFGGLVVGHVNAPGAGWDKVRLPGTAGWDKMAEDGLAVHAFDKKLNEMNRLSDMGHFPALVNAGATANVMATVGVTWWLVPRHPQMYAPVVWVAVVLALNLLPVVVLRSGMGAGTAYPRLGAMDFVRDQHKFSDWVYVAASANMAFWVLTAWAMFSVAGSVGSLVGMVAAAFLVTFAPVLLRFSPLGKAVDAR